MKTIAVFIIALLLTGCTVTIYEGQGWRVEGRVKATPEGWKNLGKRLGLPGSDPSEESSK